MNKNNKEKRTFNIEHRQPNLNSINPNLFRFKNSRIQSE